MLPLNRRAALDAPSCRRQIASHCNRPTHDSNNSESSIPRVTAKMADSMYFVS